MFTMAKAHLSFCPSAAPCFFQTTLCRKQLAKTKDVPLGETAPAELVGHLDRDNNEYLNVASFVLCHDFMVRC
jgi:hypothetical protein